MSLQDQYKSLLVDDTFAPQLKLEEASNLKEIYEEFMESYLKHKDDMPLDSWLQMELANHLPDTTSPEISAMASEIIETIERNEQQQAQLKEYVKS